MMEYSETSGFWIFNQVQNFAYTKYNQIHPEIAKIQEQMEKEFIAFTPAIDAGAQSLLETDKEMAIQYLTDYSNSVAERTFKTWKGLYNYLFVKYMDGNVKTAAEVPEGYKYIAPKVEQPGYSPEKYKLIIEKTGDQFKVKGATH